MEVYYTAFYSHGFSNMIVYIYFLYEQFLFNLILQCLFYNLSSYNLNFFTSSPSIRHLFLFLIAQHSEPRNEEGRANILYNLNLNFLKYIFI